VAVAVADASVASAVRKLTVLGPKTLDTKTRRSTLKSATRVTTAIVTPSEATRAAAAMRAGSDRRRSALSTAAERRSTP
jgi:hypothetical protein